MSPAPPVLTCYSHEVSSLLPIRSFAAQMRCHLYYPFIHCYLGEMSPVLSTRQPAVHMRCHMYCPFSYLLLTYEMSPLCPLIHMNCYSTAQSLTCYSHMRCHLYCPLIPLLLT